MHELVDAIHAEYGGAGLSLSLPSLRIETASADLLAKLGDTRRSGFTFAPEAATERMRNLINKYVPTAQVLQTARDVYSGGWRTIKFYFMIGHPDETLDDVWAIIDLCKAVLREGRAVLGNKANVNVGVSTFIPKPHTPFQWVPQDAPEQVLEKQRLLKRELRGPGLHLRWNDIESSEFEGFLSRGDRRLGQVVHRAWQLGCVFDAWQDRHHHERWLQAFAEAGLEPDFYNRRARHDDEIFPWEHIDVAVHRKFLLQDYQMSLRGDTRVDCRDKCFACGILPKFAGTRSQTPAPAWECPPVRPDFRTKARGPTCPSCPEPGASRSPCASRWKANTRSTATGIPPAIPTPPLALLAAALLTEQPVILHNLPRVGSTLRFIDIIEWLGAEAHFLADTTLQLRAARLSRHTLRHDQLDNAGALLLLAPLLARRRQLRLESDAPRSRIRTHLDALRDLGQILRPLPGAVEIHARPWQKRELLLDSASVTATGMVLMLAATLGRETLIHNAACEPHVQELCRLLQTMGARITGPRLPTCSAFRASPTPAAPLRTSAPNHIEAAAIAAIAALCGGQVSLRGTRNADLRMIARVFHQLGVHLELNADDQVLPRRRPPAEPDRLDELDARVESAIWPGFPSDLVAVATVVATQATGTALIHEKLFNNRLLFVDRLKAMGAQVVLCDPHRALVVGPAPLYGIYMATPDIPRRPRHAGRRPGRAGPLHHR